MSWTLDGIPIAQLDLDVPAFGAWWAYVTTDAQPSSGALVLGDVEWTGTIRSQRADGPRWRTFIVGGAGGLTVELPHRQVRGPSVNVRSVAARICSLAGEKLGDAPGTPLATYHRRKGTAGDALSSLCAPLGLAWRVDRLGVVHIYDPATGTAPEPVGTLAGATSNVRRYTGVPSVDLDVTQGHARATLLNGAATVSVYDSEYERPEPPRIPGVFGGRVVSQDGSLVDLRVDERWDLAAVPLFVGLPGVHVELEPGARVLVTYLDEDPRRPVAMLSPDGDESAVSYEIGGGHATVVRDGDLVNIPGVAGATGVPIVLASPPGSPATLRSKVRA